MRAALHPRRARRVAAAPHRVRGAGPVTLPGRRCPSGRAVCAACVSVRCASSVLLTLLPVGALWPFSCSSATSPPRCCCAPRAGSCARCRPTRGARPREAPRARALPPLLTRQGAPSALRQPVAPRRVARVRGRAVAGGRGAARRERAAACQPAAGAAPDGVLRGEAPARFQPGLLREGLRGAVAVAGPARGARGPAALALPSAARARAASIAAVTASTMPCRAVRYLCMHPPRMRATSAAQLPRSASPPPSSRAQVPSRSVNCCAQAGQLVRGPPTRSLPSPRTRRSRSARSRNTIALRTNHAARPLEGNRAAARS